MEKQQVPVVQLNSGHKMPLIGMGTSAMPLPNEELCSIFINAIEIGYRHFDAATLYGSEEALGQAVVEAIRRGLIKSREEMFITSKLWCTDAHHDLVLPAVKKTLKRLGLEYLDLYLVHWPVRVKHGMKHNVNSLKFTAEDMLPFDTLNTWEAMEECSRLGLSRSIGVSNFSSKKLSQLLEHASIPPAVNQVEMNVAWKQKKLRDYCKEKGIHVSAWSPLAANGGSWGSLDVMESPLLKEIAATRGKGISQIALRWIYEQGSSVIVKSFNKERMKANIEIFDWELREEDLRKIDQVPQRRGYLGDVFIHENGPYKSLQELWDDDDC